MQISPLADHPGFAPSIARWLLDHWRFALPGDTLDARITRLQAHMRRDGLPMALVAHRDGDILGTVALRPHDLPDHTDLTPWLGGLFVPPGLRRQGLGQALCRAAEQEARRMGIGQLHLFTLDRQSWYAAQGWRTLAPCDWQGLPGHIMVKRLQPPAGPAAC
jgi:putative hydrolase of the HAD superfamily